MEQDLPASFTGIIAWLALVTACLVFFLSPLFCSNSLCSALILSWDWAAATCSTSQVIVSKLETALARTCCTYVSYLAEETSAVGYTSTVGYPSTAKDKYAPPPYIYNLI